MVHTCALPVMPSARPRRPAHLGGGVAGLQVRHPAGLGLGGPRTALTENVKGPLPSLC